jgi:hypothetical protein
MIRGRLKAEAVVVDGRCAMHSLGPGRVETVAVEVIVVGEGVNRRWEGARRPPPVTFFPREG